MKGQPIADILREILDTDEDQQSPNIPRDLRERAEAALDQPEPSVHESRGPR
jgi:hypothetical protein